MSGEAMTAKDLNNVDIHRALRFLARHDSSAANQVVMVAPVEKKITYHMRDTDASEWRHDTVDLSARDIARGSLALLDEDEARLEEALAFVADYAAGRTDLGFGKLAYGSLETIEIVRKFMGIDGDRLMKAIRNLRFSMARHGMIDWEDVR